MKLGYELTIEQTQKLVMTPELIRPSSCCNLIPRAEIMWEQLLTNPVLERAGKQTEQPDTEPGDESEKAAEGTEETGPQFDWAEHFKSMATMISATVWVWIAMSKTITLMSSLSLLRPARQTISCAAGVRIHETGLQDDRPVSQSLDENGYLTSSIQEVCQVFGPGR